MKTKKDIQSLVRENVRGLKPYSSARDEYTSDGSGMIFLDANENPFDNGVNRYPDPQQRNLKKVLAAQKGLPMTSLLLGNGSDEVLDLLYRAFCEPGIDNVISLPPTYGMYKVLAGVNGVENREVPLTPGFEPDVDRILGTVSEKTKMIFICSPNNPTGNSMASDRIEALLEAFDGLVVIDEAYIDFSPLESWTSRLGQYANLVVTQTLSKAYGMAGIRLGMCWAGEDVINTLNKIKPPYNVNELTQQRALKGVLDKKRTEEQVLQIIQERKVLTRELQSIPFVQHLYRSDANFILARVDDAGKRYNQLLEQGVVVRNRSGQLHCENTLRFTVGTSEENKKLLNILKSIS